MAEFTVVICDECGTEVQDVVDFRVKNEHVVLCFECAEKLEEPLPNFSKRVIQILAEAEGL